MNGDRKVVELIEIAWRESESFAAEQLNQCPCDECEGLRRSVAGRRTVFPPDDVVDANYDKLPLLAPPAFRAFLGAFMRRGLLRPNDDEFVGGNQVLEFTTYSVVQSRRNRVDSEAWWKARVEGLSREQCQAILAFIRRARQRAGYLDSKTLDRAEEYWAARSEHGRKDA